MKNSLINTTKMLVLAMAKLDGGEVVLAGIDARRWMNNAHDTAAINLHAEGLGEYRAGDAYRSASFVINAEGIQRLTR